MGPAGPEYYIPVCLNTGRQLRLGATLRPLAAGPPQPPAAASKLMMDPGLPELKARHGIAVVSHRCIVRRFEVNQEYAFSSSLKVPTRSRRTTPG